MYKIAKKYFGSRVHFWHEMNETGDERQWGYYDWQEVHDADRRLRVFSYDKNTGRDIIGDDVRPSLDK